MNERKTSLSKAAILISALLIGIGLGAVALPPALTSRIHLALGSVLAYLLATLVGAAYVGGSLILMRRNARKDWQLDQDLLAAFLDYIPDNVYFKDRKSRFMRASRTMANYCGLANPEQIVNKTDADIFSGEHARQALADEQEIIKTGMPLVDKEEKETWPDGHETWASTTKVALRDRHGDIIGTMGISHDVTSQKQAEQRMHNLALYDALTGLPNRSLLEDRLAQAVAAAKRRRNILAVLSINLDRFKDVNSSLGHHTGDRVLQAVAQRLTRFTRASDTIARVGGDEFVLACSDVVDCAALEQIASKVANLISESFVVDQHEIHLTASIGVSHFPEDGKDADALLHAADAAMYAAKKKGRGRVNSYSAAMTAATRRQNALDGELLDAWSRDEFVIHYQPFVDASSGRIVGMEALLRWKHPQLGLIPPDRFIPQLEELGMMTEVGRWVLRTACCQVKDWSRRYAMPLRMAVNVSSQQFYEGDIVDAVEAAIRDSNVDPKHLELELTESRLFDDSEATVAIMRHLKQIGVSLSLDDFGTGWSSLSYLRRFPLDRIKIDRSFVRDLTTQESARAMVKGILALSKNLGFSAIAEGVETLEQKELLRSFGCPELQGYFFSYPLLAAEAAALLWSSKTQSAHGPQSRNDAARSNLVSGLERARHSVAPRETSRISGSSTAQ
jgi:diguanylate cyclase (GGDEF)-like protein/PAS domain S-box-containing protein